MKRLGPSLIVGTVFILLALVPAFGAEWQAKVGAQSNDKGRQALAFLPNEIWIHAGDSVTWTFEVDEIHTVTFLANGGVRLPFPVGCPGFSGPSASFDGSTCISTPPSTSGQTFTVMFPTPGNYKQTCLVHEDMTAVVHVLDTSIPLPHDQSFYDKEAAKEAAKIKSRLFRRLALGLLRRLVLGLLRRLVLGLLLGCTRRCRWRSGVGELLACPV